MSEMQIDKKTGAGSQKTILITGCTPGGIGFESCLKLKKAGFDVIASCRKENDVEKLIHNGFKTVQLDLASTQSINKAFIDVKSMANGRLFGLFNNAGFANPGALEDIETDVLREQFETNVFGTHHLTKKCLTLMLPYHEGRIVQNSSVLGYVCMPYRGAYNASKYALEAISDTMRLELKKTGISVSIIEPGPILTQFRTNSLNNLKKNLYIDQSRHQKNYLAMIERMEKKGAAVPFTLAPSSVAKIVTRAMISKRPKNRYRVTVPAIMFWYLKKFVPESMLDQMLTKGI